MSFFQKRKNTFHRMGQVLEYIPVLLMFIIGFPSWLRSSSFPRENETKTLMAGLLAQLPRAAIPSRFSTVDSMAGSALQWRDRAGFSPVFPFTVDIVTNSTISVILFNCGHRIT